MTNMPRNEREASHQTALAGKREGIRHFLRSCAIRECQSKINKRFEMVPGNFEKVPDDKAVPLSTADS